MFCPRVWCLHTPSPAIVLGFGRITIFFGVVVHFSCLFITSSRIRSFIIVHLTFVSVCYHKEMVCISLFSSFDFILRHLGSIMFTL